MAANYLHGVETIELNKGPVPVSVVKSAVIGLVGTAPKGPVNALTVVQSAMDAAQFGEQVPGFDIPQALAAILAHGAGLVVVVNTFNFATNTAQVTDEVLSATANGKTKLAFAPIPDAAGASSLSIVKGSNTAVAASAYSMDAYGNLTVLDYTVIPDGTVLKATYKKLDAATLSDAQMIGTVNSGTNVKTGYKLFAECFNSFGFVPKILISPNFSEKPAVATEMLSAADKYRAIALLDAPAGTTPQEAIAGRGPSGTVGRFNTSSKRAYLLYPRLKAFDPATNAIVLRPYAPFMAGVMAATDNSLGYWNSPSNKEIKGITGMERNLTAAANDAGTEVNLLNEKGITTIFNSFGTGLRTWGNRSAAFPTSTAPSNFISVQRTADIIHESLELAMLQFIDRPITQATIDSVRETVNGFMRSLIQREAIVDGKCTFDKAKNTPVELSAGHLTFDITFMPPTPAERITFDSFIDINLLKSLA
jgi:phage tail sheath protein FI